MMEEWSISRDGEEVIASETGGASDPELEELLDSELFVLPP